MKKLLLALGLTLGLTTTAQAAFSVGIDYVLPESGTGTTSFSDSTPDSTSDIEMPDSALRFKLAFGQLGKSIGEFYYTSYTSDYAEFGYNYKPSWELTDNLFLNLKLGVVYGYSDIDVTYNQDGWYNVGFKGGLNISYVLIDSVELNAGWDYKYQLWQDLEYFDGTTISSTQTLSGLYFGVSYWFGSATGNKKSTSNNAPMNYQDDNVNSTQKYNSHDQSYNGSSNNAEDVVY